MAEFSIDRFVDLYAHRTSGMSASEVRALFAVASRPEVVSLAGGMPFVQALPDRRRARRRPGRARRARRDVAAVRRRAGAPRAARATRRIDGGRGRRRRPRGHGVTTGAQQALDLIGKIFIDPGDLIAVEAPAYVGALTAFGAVRTALPADRDRRRRHDRRSARGSPGTGRATEVRLHLPELRQSRRCDVIIQPTRTARRPVPRGGHPDRRGQPLRHAPLRGRAPSRPCEPSTPRT